MTLAYHVPVVLVWGVWAWAWAVAFSRCMHVCRVLYTLRAKFVGADVVTLPPTSVSLISVSFQVCCKNGCLKEWRGGNQKLYSLVVSVSLLWAYPSPCIVTSSTTGDVPAGSVFKLIHQTDLISLEEALEALD